MPREAEDRSTSSGAPPRGDNPHLTTSLERLGTDPATAPGVLVVIHGRNGSPQRIREQLLDRLHRPDLSYLLPAAEGHSWYPGRFMDPIETNEPRLSFALERLDAVAAELDGLEVPSERVIWVGNSQGACLAAEWVARHPRRWGGLAVFSGGLMGPPGTVLERPGDLGGTPVLIGIGDTDDWAPLARIQETAAAFTAMGAEVDLRVYPGMGHVVNDDEHEAFAGLVASLAGATEA